MTNQQLTIFHNQVGYRIDNEIDFRKVSHRAQELLSGEPPYRVFDSYDEVTFSTFIDAIHQKPINITPTIVKPITQLIIDWSAPFVAQEIQKQVISHNDINLMISFLCCSTSIYPQFYSFISTHSNSIMKKYPDFYNLPVEVLGSLFLPNLESHSLLKTTAEFRKTFDSIQEEYKKLENTSNSYFDDADITIDYFDVGKENDELPGDEIIEPEIEAQQLKEEIEKLKQQKSNWESRLNSVRIKIAQTQNQIPVYKEQTSDKLSQIQDILQLYDSELKQLNSINQEVADYEKQIHDFKKHIEMMKKET